MNATIRVASVLSRVTKVVARVCTERDRSRLIGDERSTTCKPTRRC
jgi:hypothetical protein